MRKLIICIIFLFSGYVNFGQDIYYVGAENGLIVRDQPSSTGNRISKLKFGQEVTVINKTGISFSVIDEGLEVTGEWVEIALVSLKNQASTKKLYVFDGYLLPKDDFDNYSLKKQNLNFSPIYPLYEYELKPNTIIEFIPLTDSFPWSDNDNSSIIEDKYLGNAKYENDNYHQLDAKHRDIFFTKMNISENHKIFVYNLSKDRIIVYPVKDQPLVGVLSPYQSGSGLTQYDYIVGFEIAKRSAENGYNRDVTFVFVGDKNPFHKGSMEPIIWNKTEVEQSLNQINKVVNNSQINKQTTKNVFKFTKNTLDYYLLDLEQENENRSMRLVVIDQQFKEVLANFMYKESEGRTFTPLILEGEPLDYGIDQWTGKMFKNKESVIFGFFYNSFGCDAIEFINPRRNYIQIKCDNRH